MVPGDPGRLLPGVGGDAHPEVVAHPDVVVDEGVAQLGAQGLDEGLAAIVGRRGLVGRFGGAVVR